MFVTLILMWNLYNSRQAKIIELCYVSVSQQFIGNVDVKKRIVHFYVQRTTSFSSPNSIIRFDSVRLNDGGAMDFENGIFTAPVFGLYHFEFSGHRASSSPSLDIALQVDGVDVGFARSIPSPAGSLSVESLSLTVSLWIKPTSKVTLFNAGSGVLFDSLKRNTHFTGWLVEEYVKIWFIERWFLFYNFWNERFKTPYRDF